jgi:integrase
MPKDRNLTLRGKIFRFRIRIPDDLTAILHRSEISRSLATSDPLVARRRLLVVGMRWNEVMDQLRTDRTLTADQIGQLIKDFIRADIDRLEALRRCAAVEPELDAVLEREVANRPHLRRLLVSSIADNSYGRIRSLFEDFLDAQGIAYARGTPAYTSFVEQVALAWLEALASPDGGSGQLGPLPPNREALPAPMAHDESKSLGELIDPYIASRKRGGAGDSYLTEIGTALSWLRQWFGADAQLAALTKTDLRDYKEGLLNLPSNWSKKLKGLTIKEAAKLNEDGHLPKLEVTALVAKRWQPVVDFLEWAKENLYVDANPAEGQRITVTKAYRKGKRRDPFEVEDLQAMFDAPVYRGAASDSDWRHTGTHQIRDHRFWIPLLALFTGGRRGELCQLAPDDVIRRDGILCIRIRERFDEDGEKTASVKNAESVRLVPVHPELERIGFEAFVERRRRAGQPRLFDCADTNNYDQFGKWFSRFLGEIGVKTPRKCFHSFRHTMETAMRENIDDFTARFRLTGRTIQHSSEEYGKGHSARILYREISKVEYPGLDLSFLYERLESAYAA